MRRILKPSQPAEAAAAERVAGYPPDPRAAARYRQQLIERIMANRIEIALVLAITAFAAGLRLWRLDTVPLGLHGDEAWTGLDARRVLHEGWIGPYVESALGQPTGPLYFTALLFSFLPDTTFTLRLSMALFGIATIPLAYFAFRSMFDATSAAFAALLLSVMTWHLQLTRTAFMVGSWPFIEMAVMLALFAGIRRRSPALIALAGALTGLGVYTYNAYALFVPVVAVALVWAIARAGEARRRVLLGAGSAIIAAVVVALPMLVYISGHYGAYRSHQRDLSVTQSAAWQQAGIAGKADIVRHRFDEWAFALARGDRPDLGDGLAAPGQPVVQPIILALAVAGLCMALWHMRETAYATVVAAVVVMPIGALATTGDGLFRRTFGLAPFLALLAALPLAWVWQRAIAPARERIAPLGAAIVLVLVALPAALGIYRYFGPAQDTYAVTFTFPYQEDAAAHYVASLPRGTQVYYYSDRWAFNYETMRFIAPNATGTDRSREYGIATPGDPLDFSAPPGKPVAFVFLGAYIDDIQSAIEQHPGGIETEGHRGDETTFRGYFVPAS